MEDEKELTGLLVIEKINKAEKLKKEGNEFYKNKDIRKALSCYHR